jgi:all-trans-retinol dehydrogenase (NAD+)
LYNWAFPYLFARQAAAKVNIGLQIYNAFILIIDIFLLNVKVLLSILEGIYKLFVQPEARDVSRDIVLVNTAMKMLSGFPYINLSSPNLDHRNRTWNWPTACLPIQCVGGHRGLLGHEWETQQRNCDRDQEAKRKSVWIHVRFQINSEISRFVFSPLHSCSVDVTDYDQVIAKGKQVQTQVGNVTVLVNNAGIMPTHPLLQQTREEIRKVFDVNVMAHFWLIQFFLPNMLEHNNGHIVALSSMAGIMGFTNLVPYCGTKFAVRGIMEAVNEEIRLDPRKPDNVKVTSIYPYMVDTGLCKRPRVRFPSLMSLVRPDEAAAAIIDAQRRGIMEASIPKYMLYMNHFTRCYPAAAGLLIKDFIDAGVESDL